MGKLTYSEAEEIRRRHEAGEALTPLAREFGISVPAASHVVRYQTHWPPGAIEMVAVFLYPEQTGALKRLAEKRGESSSAYLSRVVRSAMPLYDHDIFGGIQSEVAEDGPPGPPEDSPALWADEGPPRPRRRRSGAGR